MRTTPHNSIGWLPQAEVWVCSGTSYIKFQ